jgi:class 3 adenylate cyclase/HAMP domain-containing protein
MSKCTIPLWLVFTLQSLIVCGAFLAVILVLSLQQQDQYKASVFREIELQQAVSNNALTSPIITRERILSQLARRMDRDPSLWFNIGDTMQSVNIQRFMNLTYFTMYEDPIAYVITQFRRAPSANDTNATSLSDLNYGFAGITSDLLLLVSNFNDTAIIAPNPAYPLQFGFTFEVPSVIQGDQTVRSPVTIWGGSLVFVDFVSGATKFISSLSYPLVYNSSLGIVELSLAYSIDVHYLVGLTKSSLLTPDSEAILVERQTGNILANFNVGATLFNAATTLPWSTTTFPNQDVVAEFQSLDATCSLANNCTKYAEEHHEHIVSLQHMTTDFGFRLSLLQTTARSFYFAAGERSVIAGAVIGVVAAVVVLVSCVVIWCAVRGPVRRLRESMELAAVMRNDEVDDTSSVLTELDLLSQSFTQMNGKLLQARAFMPQSMLFGGEDGDDEDEVEAVDADEEGAALSYLGASNRKSDQMSDLGGSVALLEMSVNPSVSSDTLGNSTIDNTPGGAGNSIMPRTHRSSNTPSMASSRKGSQYLRKGRGMVMGPTINSLVSKKVGVLTINARGTHNLATNGGVARLESEQVRLVELVERCARAEKGVVDAFQGDHFVLTFNAVRSVGSPGRNGALVGLSVEEGAQRDGLTLGEFSMGLSVGRAYVGNVGSATMKKNCTVGGVFTTAVGLERLAKRLGRTCVVNGRCLNDLEHAVYYMLLGSVQLSFDTRDVAGCVMGRVEGPTGGDQEWLYQMERKANPFREYNELIETYLKEGVDAVSRVLDGIGARVDDPESGFAPGAIAHLLALMKRRRHLDAIPADTLTDIHVGGHHSFDADFDVQST